MKNNKLITCVSILSLALFLNTAKIDVARAFVYADFINIAQGAIEDIGEALKQVGATVKKVQATLASLKIGGKKDKKEEKLGELASANTVEQNLDCADIVIDGSKSKQEYEEAIYGLMGELFFTSPYCKSDLNYKSKNMAYELEAKKFYEDSLVEAVTAALNIEKEIEKIKEEIKLFEEEIAGADSTSEIDTSYYNLKANILYDEGLKLFEELLAIKAQLTAAAIIEETDANQKEECTQENAELSLQYQSSQPHYFAKLELGAAKPQIPENLLNRIEFKEEFAKFETIEKLGLEAIDLHYNVNKMQDYKSLYKRHADLQDRKKEIIDVSNTIEKCTKGLFTKVGMTDVDNKWQDLASRAKNTFELMKAKMMDSADEEMEQVPLVEKFNTTDVKSAQPTEDQIAEEQKENSEESSEGTLESKMENFKSKLGLKVNKKKEKKTDQDDAARDISVMAWRIGSQVVKNLETDGDLKFPIWYDVKNFYDIYLDKKYAAVKEFVTGNIRAAKTDIKKQVAEKLKDNFPQEELEKLEKEIDNQFNGITEKIGFKTAENVLKCQIIDDLVTDIKSADASYTASGALGVAEKHKTAMEKIKALDGISVVVSVEGQVIEVVKTAAEIMFGNKEADFEQEKEHYFVGVDNRVLKAPMSAPENTRLPLREVLHLDDTDFANWMSLNNGVTFASFKSYYEAEYGDLPAIWSYMLNKEVFVTKVDANGRVVAAEPFPLLNIGVTALNKVNLLQFEWGGIQPYQEVMAKEELITTSPEFLWGGIYPCKAKNNTSLLLGLDVKKQGTDESWPRKEIVPSYVKLDESKFAGYDIKVCHFNEQNDEKIKDSRCAIKKSLFGSENCKGEAIKEEAQHYGKSELASLFVLEKPESGLVLNPQIHRVLNFVYEKSADTDVSEPTYEENLAQDMLFAKNHVGAYLEAYDARVDIENQLAELEKQIKEAETTIANLLKSVGYSVSEEINIDKNYDDIRKKLLSARNKKVNQFADSMSSVKVKGQKALERKLMNHQALLAAFNLDKDCFLNIDYNSIPVNAETGEINITDLQSELKTKKADRATVNKYETDASDAAGIDIKPYCGVYRIK